MNIRTELREVSIYRRGCTVRRYGEAQLEAGRHQLRIEGLTAGTDASSVRIMLSQPLHGSNVQVRWPDEEEQKALCEEIDQKIALCEARILACSAQEEVWKTNTDLSANTNASLETISAYADALPAKLEEIFLKKAELEKEKEKLLKERQKIQKEIARPYVSMFAECDKAGTYQIIAEYYEPHASWNPVYEIRAEEDRPLNIRLRAAMRQSTGEDWKDAKLTLFTGNPSMSAEIPQLTPVHLGFYQPPVFNARAKNALMSGKAAPMMMAMADTNAVEDTMEMAFDVVEEETAEIREGETMTEYQLAGTWSLVSGAPEERADLSSSEIPCAFHAVSVPGRSGSAYLAAEIRTADIADLINTNASLYLNGTYTGDIVLNADPLKETYDLSLGRDETIRVSRTQKKKYTSQVLLKQQTRREHEYEISVVSGKKKPCRITIIDQIPVSDEKTITVDNVTLSGGKLNSDTGEVRWDLDMKPEESRTLTLAYTLAWPKDKRIQETAVQNSPFCPECGSLTHGMKFCPECGRKMY